MKKQESITPGSDHLWLRIIGFVLALTVAVGAFSYGVMGIGRKEKGYQNIEAEPDEEAVMYAKGITFQYYFDGSSDEIKLAIKELGAAYSPALLRLYKLLDSETEYEGFANIATLNAHIGEDVAISDELYRVLLDAKEKTLEQKGFNMFAGAFYRAWQDIRYISDPENYDPLNNDTERERLERLQKASSDLSNFDLVTVDEEKHIVRLEVSESYLALLQELEQEGPVLDLNLLHDAYELQLLGEILVKAGYQDGYITTSGGISVILPGNPDGDLCLYGRIPEGMTPAAMTPAAGGCAACITRAFAREEGEPDYYELGGQLRHPWLPASGAYRNQLLAAMTVADDAVTACYLNLQLQDLASAEELRAAAAASGGIVAYILAGDAERTVYSNSDSVSARDDYGWQLEIIQG